jgi:tubulin-folding cofactor B
MSLQSAADVPLLVISANSSSERRVTPSWTIAHLKIRLEPITGIPAGCQQLALKIGSQEPVAIEAADEEQTQLASFPLQAYAELTVSFCISFITVKRKRSRVRSIQSPCSWNA